MSNPKKAGGFTSKDGTVKIPEPQLAGMKAAYAEVKTTKVKAKKFPFLPDQIFALYIKIGQFDAYDAGVAVRVDPKFGADFGATVAMELATDKKLDAVKLKEFLAGFNGLPKTADFTSDTAVLATKPLQPVAAPATVSMTKEGTMAKITTQVDFTNAGDVEVAALETLEAPKVGQKVAGTSPGAVYYIVAVAEGANGGSGLAVAMRWKGAQLSVRISGAALPEYAERLMATGLFANHGHYFSAHMGQQGAVDGLAASVSAQMLYASVLASIAGDTDAWTERAPYAWRNWMATGPVN